MTVLEGKRPRDLTRPFRRLYTPVSVSLRKQRAATGCGRFPFVKLHRDRYAVLRTHSKSSLVWVDPVDELGALKISRESTEDVREVENRNWGPTSWG